MKKLLIILSLIFSVSFMSFAQDGTKALSTDNTPKETDTKDDSEDIPEDTLWYMEKDVADIVFQGLKTLKKKDLLPILKQFIGKPFNEELIRNLQDSLYTLDYFDEITPYADKYKNKKEKVVLRLVVKEKQRIDNVFIYGNVKLRDSSLTDLISSKKGSFYSEIKAKQDVQSIKDKYFEKGFLDTKIEYNFVKAKDKNGKNVQNLEFNVKEGGQTVVRKITFLGNENMKASKLISKLATKRKSPINSGLFKGKENFDIDKQKILEFYGNNGYIDAEIVDIQTEKIEPKKRRKSDKNIYIGIKYYIKEHDKWTFNSINFVGNKIFKTKRFKPYINHKKGKTINITKINKIVANVQKEYADNGYIFNTINLSSKRNKKDKSIDFTVKIQERGKGYIGKIIIRGNKKTKNYVIRRELEIHEGEVYDLSKLQKSIENLYNTRFFSAINPKPVPGKGDRTVDIILDVEEGKTVQSLVGGSFGGDPRFPLSGMLKWSDSNVAGRAYIISANATLSWYTQQASLQFVDPWAFNQRIAWGADFTYTHSLSSNLAQDVQKPIFGDNDLNAVPDPYKGYYVFSKDTTYNGTKYKRGDMFPKVPSLDDIKKYSLLTDYRYNGGSYSLEKDDNMTYQEHTISLGTSLRYTLMVPVLKRFTPFIGQRFSFSYLTYKDEFFRPYSRSVANSNKKWSFVPKTYFGFEFDGRDLIYSPSKGYFFSQTFTFAYGKNKTYFRNDTKFQMFFTLWNLKVSDSWSWKMILAINTEFSILYPLGKKDGNPNFSPGTDLLFTNGMNVGRGWGFHQGEALWLNWLELRMPLVEKIVWFDMYFEALDLTSKYTDFLSSEYWRNSIYNDWYFGFGFGFRFTIPNFPIRIYLAKLFKIDKNGKAIWQRGNIFYSKNNPYSGVSLIFSIGF